MGRQRLSIFSDTPLADARAAARLLGKAGEKLWRERFVHAPARAFAVARRGEMAFVRLAAERASVGCVGHDAENYFFSLRYTLWQAAQLCVTFFSARARSTVAEASS